MQHVCLLPMNEKAEILAQLEDPGSWCFSERQTPPKDMSCVETWIKTMVLSPFHHGVGDPQLDTVVQVDST